MPTPRDRISGPKGILAALQPRTGVARAAWWVLSATVTGCALGLVAFHLWLFWDQLATGRLMDPEVAVRWTVAGLLSGVLVVLRHLGVSLTRGRRALSVWLLVVLLHVWGAASPGIALEVSGQATGHESSGWFVLPATATLLLGVGLLLLGPFRASWRPPVFALAYTCSCPDLVLRRIECGSLLPARAPPFATV